MKRFVKFILIVYSITLAQTSTQIDSIHHLMDLFPEKAQFSVAFIQGDKVNYYGAIKQGGNIETVDNRNRVFEIGSITKVFTSTILANLVHEGRIELDKPLQDYVPFKLKRTEKKGVTVTVQMLANHTSGLPRMPSGMIWDILRNGDNPYVNYDLKRMGKYFKKKMKLKTIPGEKNQYSNLGAGFLGHVLEYNSGMQYADLLNRYVIEKYSMTSTSLDRVDLEDRVVKGIDKKGREVSHWDLNAFQPAGGVVSTVADLSNFAQANFSGDPVLTLQRTKTFQVREGVDVALGWIVLEKEGKTLHWHNGGTGGYTSSMAINVEDQTGVVILTNVSVFIKDSRKIDALCLKLMKMMN